jgi:D-lactate dehydrogenase
LEGHALVFVDEVLQEKHVSRLQDIEVLAVFIYSQVSSTIIDALPRLKLIATMSTGFDHIDVAYCKKKGVKVCNVPTYGENTVAEHTFALILALSRRVYPSIKRTHEQHSFETDASLRGFDLKGRTLGLVGCGNIGKHVARIGVGLEMDVFVFDLVKDASLAKKIGFRYASLSQLWSTSDIISLHVPHNKKTHHLVDGKAIASMKDGVFLINTSRGSVIDTHALVKALRSGKVAGAGLDVLEEECAVKEEAALLTDEFKETCDMATILENHLLMKMDNVIITPHNAFNSSEALLRILETTLENIVGKGLKNKV